jgi:hypothetical protein
MSTRQHTSQDNVPDWSDHLDQGIAAIRRLRKKCDLAFNYEMQRPSLLPFAA